MAYARAVLNAALVRDQTTASHIGMQRVGSTRGEVLSDICVLLSKHLAEGHGNDLEVWALKTNMAVARGDLRTARDMVVKGALAATCEGGPSQGQQLAGEAAISMATLLVIGAILPRPEDRQLVRPGVPSDPTRRPFQ